MFGVFEQLQFERLRQVVRLFRDSEVLVVRGEALVLHFVMVV
jgi:hypothetical protein